MLRFHILGPLRAVKDGRRLELGLPRQQLILAALLCHANSVVPADSLIDAIWQGSPPRTARKNLQGHVCALRARLWPAERRRLAHERGGYVLRVGPGELDALAFDRELAGLRRPAGGPPADALARALDLWSGPVLPGLRGSPVIDGPAQRLESRFLTVFEEWAEAEVAAGGALRAIDRITRVAEEHPCRERLRMAQMAALCDLDRRADALAVYDEVRRELARELGLSPGRALAQFYQDLLSDEPPGRPRASASSPAGARTSLPREPPAFTGRAECAETVMAALARGGERLAVLSGPLGAGKTALAVHCARRLREEFPDGQFFARVRDNGGTPLPPDAVLAQLTRAAGSRWPRPAGDAWQWWQHWLADHRALVVLDGAAREAQVRPFLPEAGDSTVILTARSSLAGLGPAFRFHVPALSAADAAEMLGAIIGSSRVAADRRSAERIVTACEFLPLAIRLLADRLAVLRHLPLREFADRVDPPAAMLGELAAVDPAVRAQLDRAFAELPDGARHACLRLADLPGRTFSLQEAARALGTTPHAAVRVLEDLLDANAVTAPATETLAHTVVYKIPLLMRLRAREMADQAAGACRGRHKREAGPARGRRVLAGRATFPRTPVPGGPPAAPAAAVR